MLLQPVLYFMWHCWFFVCHRPHNGLYNLNYTATIMKEKLPCVVDRLNYLDMVWSYEMVARLIHANKETLKCLIGLAVWSRAMIILLTNPNAKT